MSSPPETGRRLSAEDIDWGPREDPSNDTSRRRVFGVLVSVALLTAFFAMSGGATAQTTFDAKNVQVTSDNGQLQSLTVAPNGTVEYSGLEKNISSITVSVSIKKSSSGSWQQLDSQSVSATGYSGTAKYSFGTIDVMQNSGLSKSDFHSKDGNTATTDLVVRISVTMQGAGAGGADVTSNETDTFTVSVENLPANGNVGGTANTNGNGK